jgi:hypothetical protein
MKYVSTIVIVVLAIGAGYFYARGQYEVRLLEAKVAELQGMVEKTREECETRIAQLKAQYARQARVQITEAPAAGPLSDLVKKLSDLQRKTEAETYADMTETLQLSDNQVQQIRGIIEKFKQTRQGILSGSRQEGTLFFDPQQLARIDEARKENLEKLRQILTAEQYQGMIDHAFDRKLGLQPPAHP